MHDFASSVSSQEKYVKDMLGGSFCNSNIHTLINKFCNMNLQLNVNKCHISIDSSEAAFYVLIDTYQADTRVANAKSQMQMLITCKHNERAYFSPFPHKRTIAAAC